MLEIPQVLRAIPQVLWAIPQALLAIPQVLLAIPQVFLEIPQALLEIPQVFPSILQEMVGSYATLHYRAKKCSIVVFFAANAVVSGATGPVQAFIIHYITLKHF